MGCSKQFVSDIVFAQPEPTSEVFLSIGGRVKNPASTLQPEKFKRGPSPKNFALGKGSATISTWICPPTSALSSTLARSIEDTGPNEIFMAGRICF